MSEKNDDDNGENKKTLLGWKTAFAAIIGIFVAGMVTVITVTSYLDKRSEERFFEKTSGMMLEQRVQIMEENYKTQDKKMDIIINQQTVLSVEVGKINGLLSSPEPRK